MFSNYIQLALIVVYDERYSLGITKLTMFMVI